MIANSRELLRTSLSPPVFLQTFVSLPSSAKILGRKKKPYFKARNIDIRGIERAPGKSFFWEGAYLDNLNEAQTHNTELNVFATFAPKIPEAYRDSEYLFLANIDPVLQRRVREAMPGVKLVAGDTMNYWIKDHRAPLLEVLEGLDALLINDTEARMLAGARTTCCRWRAAFSCLVRRR